MEDNICYLRVGPLKFKCTNKQLGISTDALMGMGGTAFVISWITYRPSVITILLITAGYMFITRKRPEYIFDKNGNGATFTYKVCAFCYSIIQGCILLIALNFALRLLV